MRGRWLQRPHPGDRPHPGESRGPDRKARRLGRWIPAFAGMKTVHAAAACLLLSACGFQPLYAPSPTVAAQGGLGEIQVAPINGRVGYFLGQGLERMLPGGGAQARTLVVEVQTTFQPLAVRVDGSAARTDLIGVARYRLDGADPSAAPLSGEVRATVSYDLLDQPFGDVAAQTDAEERLASVLAERIRTELVLRQRAAAQAAQ